MISNSKMFPLAVEVDLIFLVAFVILFIYLFIVKQNKKKRIRNNIGVLKNLSASLLVLFLYFNTALRKKQVSTVVESLVLFWIATATNDYFHSEFI